MFTPELLEPSMVKVPSIFVLKDKKTWNSFLNMNTRLDNVSLYLKEAMGYEAIISQLQSSTKKVLCVEDGLYLRIFEESGPFPLGVTFEHKQKRWGMNEYFFRYAIGTEDETVLCVFGRDNAETFCPDFIDDQDTSEEDDLHLSSPIPEEEIFSDIYTSSDTNEEEILKDTNIHGEAKHNEAKHDEAKHDEAKHDEAKHDEAKHDEAKHDEAKHDEAKHDEGLRFTRECL